MPYKGIFDFVFLSSNIKTMSSKEDAYAYNMTGADDGFIGVFDGCGGLGSRKYPMADNHTGAFLAARAACSAIYNLYEKKEEAFDAANMKKALVRKIRSLKEKTDDGRPELIGSMVKTFPTTMTVAYAQKSESGVKGKFVWAGDSRGYILDANGLKQMTKDDITGDEDAFENLYNDSPLSNLVHISGDFKLNETAFEVKAPSVIIVATDGVFGYLPSPMHFEMLLLDTLMNAKSISDWETALENKFNEISGDDATIIMTGVKLEGSFRHLKEMFRKRHTYLAGLLANADSRDKLESIWQKTYKTSYEKK